MTELLFIVVIVIYAIQDIDHLQQVWEITHKCNINWNIWKTSHFAELQTEDMESTAQEMLQKLHNLQIELKVSHR